MGRLSPLYTTVLRLGDSMKIAKAYPRLSYARRVS